MVAKKVNIHTKISVLMAVYNGEKFLKEAVDSILNQTFGDFEFFIVNDASTDSTTQILLQFTDSRIKIFNNESNKGLTYNLNQMLSMSCGKYIARMDADDIALPHRFQTQYEYLESHPEIGICGSYVEAFYEGSGKKQIVKFAKDDASIRSFAFFQSPFCHPTVMMRKDVLVNNSLQYPLSYRLGQDYALWVELLKVTQGANLSEVLLRFRKHDENISLKCFSNNNERIHLLNAIHQTYLSLYGICMNNDELYSYSQFVDRFIQSDLSIANQKKLVGILNRVSTQIAKESAYMRSSWNYYLSIICFYNFYIEKKVPLTFYLQKLYCRGAFAYLSKIIKQQFTV